MPTASWTRRPSRTPSGWRRSPSGLDRAPAGHRPPAARPVRLPAGGARAGERGAARGTVAEQDLDEDTAWLLDRVLSRVTSRAPESALSEALSERTLAPGDLRRAVEVHAQRVPARALTGQPVLVRRPVERGGRRPARARRCPAAAGTPCTRACPGRPASRSTAAPRRRRSRSPAGSGSAWTGSSS